METIELTYSVREADMLLAVRRQYWNSKALRQRIRRSYLGPVVALALLTLGAWMLAPGTLVGPTLAAATLFAAISYPIIVRMRLERRVRQLIHAYATPDALVPRTLRLDGEWLEEVTGHSQSRLALSMVDGVGVVDTQAIVSMHGLPLMVIPRERVTAGDFDRFVQALQEGAHRAKEKAIPAPSPADHAAAI